MRATLASNWFSRLRVVCEQLAMRMTVIASIVALSAACGIEPPTVPTGSVGSVAPPPVPPALLPGNYEVVFAADAVCTGLTEAVRTRTYSASLAGSTIDLAGAIFASAPSGRGFRVGACERPTGLGVPDARYRSLDRRHG
jgi:hypothetical protein